MDMLEASIQDEYHARYTYLVVLIDYPNRTPFANIAEAEAQHIESVAQLFVKRGLPVPASKWNLGNVPRFATFTQACQGGVQGEIENYQMYEGFLAAGELPHDVGNVFLNLMLASRDKHLPAFQVCAQ
jgi:hypothetical protein